ncbi:MAG: ATP-binding protein [Puniceicoccaceae bacterium]
MNLTHTVETVDFSTNKPKLKEMTRALEVIQVSLDQEGYIKTINPAGIELLARPGEDIRGKDFEQTLLKLNPGWSEFLPDDIVELCIEPLFLPWGRKSQPGLGWNVQALPASDEPDTGLLVSMIPSLAPEYGDHTPEEGFENEIDSPLHKLFYRAQQVESRFRQFLRLLPGVPYTQDKDLTFSYHNEQLRTLIGEKLSLQLAEEADWQSWIHPDDRDTFNQNLDQCRFKMKPVSSRYRLQLPHTDRILYILDIRIPVRSLDGELTGFEGLWLDLTRQTLAEKRLQRAAWKECLAEITGSLSHDFNNILMGIVNLSDLMNKSEIIDPVTHKYDSKIIYDSARQAQQIIKRIIGLNREHAGIVRLHNLVEIVEQQTDLIRIVLPRNVKLEVKTPDEEIPVLLDQSAIRRILLNFTTNARDALKYKGQVTISLKTVDLENYPRDHMLSDRCGTTGKAAELVFKDNGSGIDPKILHRIFDPYFSTKEAGRGSGLGLYSMTQFAQDNGFDFGVRSWVGMGTEMYVLIPVEKLDSNTTPVPLNKAKKGAAVSKRQQLVKVGLFAPMDDAILKLTRAFIRQGIHVDNLEDASTACQWLNDADPGKQTIVVFMDHRKELPDKLAEKLRDANGRVPRILCYTGFNPDEISHLQGDCVDQILEQHSVAEENLQSIMQHAMLRQADDPKTGDPSA